MSTSAENTFRILVIDDVQDIHEDFRKILIHEESSQKKNLENMHQHLFHQKTMAGSLPQFEIDCVFQGQDGINCVQKSVKEKRPYAIAFVDVQMPPGIDGIQTIERIWEIDADIQVVICTAYAKYSWEEIFQRFGNTDHLFILKKPFDRIEIINLACTLTKRWSLNRLVNAEMARLKGISIQEKKEDGGAFNKLKEAMDMLENLNNKLKNKS